MKAQTLSSTASSEPYRMSDSFCARQPARSSTLIVSESLFPIRSHRNVLPQSPESTSWVGRSGPLSFYLQKDKLPGPNFGLVSTHCSRILFSEPWKNWINPSLRLSPGHHHLVSLPRGKGQLVILTRNSSLTDSSVLSTTMNERSF
jgi:hypothetical protein